MRGLPAAGLSLVLALPGLGARDSEGAVCIDAGRSGLEMWWEQGTYGTGDDLLPHYWFAADFSRKAWRPLPNTPLLPREKWAFGDSFMGSINQVRWNEPLAGSIVTSVIACRHAPSVAERAEAMARRILGALDEARLHWMVDPDGKQLPPAIRYYGRCMSSEMGDSHHAAPATPGQIQPGGYRFDGSSAYGSIISLGGAELMVIYDCFTPDEFGIYVVRAKVDSRSDAADTR